MQPLQAGAAEQRLGGDPPVLARDARPVVVILRILRADPHMPAFAGKRQEGLAATRQSRDAEPGSRSEHQFRASSGHDAGADRGDVTLLDKGQGERCRLEIIQQKPLFEPAGLGDGRAVEMPGRIGQARRAPGDGAGGADDGRTRGVPRRRRRSPRSGRLPGPAWAAVASLVTRRGGLARRAGEGKTRIGAADIGDDQRVREGSGNVHAHEDTVQACAV